MRDVQQIDQVTERRCQVVRRTTGKLQQRRVVTGEPLGHRVDEPALQRLPVEQREPLLLVTLEQLSYAECAELLRIPVGTVMSRISRGRAALRALLDGRAPLAGTPGLRRVV